MLESISRNPSIQNFKNNWKTIAGLSAALVATIGFLAKRILAKASTKPVEEPMNYYTYPDSFVITKPLQFNADQPVSINGIASLVQDMEGFLEAKLEKTKTHFYDSFTTIELCSHFYDTQPGILITFAGVTYACVKRSDTYRVFIPYFSKKTECRATIRDFSSIDDLFSHLFGEGIDAEYPLAETAERMQVMETLGSLENKPFTFKSVKKELEKNWVLSSRFEFLEHVNQDYFDEFNKTHPLEHPANRLKLLAEIYCVKYSPVILTPLQKRAVGSTLSFENAGEE